MSERKWNTVYPDITYDMVISALRDYLMDEGSGVEVIRKCFKSYLPIISEENMRRKLLVDADHRAYDYSNHMCRGDFAKRDYVYKKFKQEALDNPRVTYDIFEILDVHAAAIRLSLDGIKAEALCGFFKGVCWDFFKKEVSFYNSIEVKDIDVYLSGKNLLMFFDLIKYQNYLFNCQTVTLGRPFCSSKLDYDLFLEISIPDEYDGFKYKIYKRKKEC